MKLLYRPMVLEIPFQENKVNVLSVEDPFTLSDMISALSNLDSVNNSFTLSINEKELNLSKKLDLIMNPFEVSTRDKKILNGLYKLLMIEESEEEFDQVNKTNQQIINLMDLLSSKTVFPLDYNLELDLNALLKAYDVHISDDSEDYLDRLLNYIKASHDICGTEVFCIYGLRYYLSEEQLRDFYKTCLYSKINILVLEPRFVGRNEYENTWIVDRDKCIINSMD